MEIFVKIGNSIAEWFIDERGWAMILGAIAVAVLGLLAIKVVLAIVHHFLKKTKLHSLSIDFIMTIAKVLVIFIYVIAILKTLKIDTSGVVAILAAGSLALSLAMQSVLTNFASGIILVGNKPFEVGDFVEVGGVSGTVQKVTLFNTCLLTPDNKIITLPNSSVAGGNIINYSVMPKRRLDLEFGVAYGSDIDKVKGVMISVLDEHELVLHEDGYNVRLSQQADSALVFICRCWVKGSDYWTVNFDLKEAMTKRFVKEGIEIPYNKLDVTLIEKK